MPEKKEPPLDDDELIGVREVLEEWPTIKAAASRQTFTDWYTGVLARNPKLSNALHLAVGVAAAWFTAWVTGLMPMGTPQKPPPEKMPVVSPEQPKAATEPTTERRIMPAAPISSRARANGSATLARLESSLPTQSEENPVTAGDPIDDFASASKLASERRLSLVVAVGCKAPAGELGSGFDWLTVDVACPWRGWQKPCLVVFGAREGGGLVYRDELPPTASADRIRAAIGMLHVEVSTAEPVEPAPEPTPAATTSPAWTIWRSLPPGWASGPQPASKLNAVERKVK